MRSASTKSAPSTAQATSGRRLGFLLAGLVGFCFLPSIALSERVHNLVVFVRSDPTWAYVPLVPVVSMYLIHMWRHSIFKRIHHAWKSGIAMCLLGAICFVLVSVDTSGLTEANRNSLLVFGFVLFWLGGFLIFFGRDSFRVALFPLLFLLFAVPIPDPPLSHMVSLLQEGSSRSAAWMFQLMGVPFLKHGFDFVLPGFTIRVAEECSGIRSTIALMICTVLGGRLFLQRPVSRLFLCLIVVPISIVKNGFRIAFLSTMAIYVSPSFLLGPLHYHGGIFFFMIALIPMFLLFQFLKSRENTVTVDSSCDGSRESTAIV